jgi:polyisoprenoid-binding protein YceI
MNNGLLAALALAACASHETPAASSDPHHEALPIGADVSTDPTRSPGGVYQLNRAHTSVVWRIRHIGVSLLTARFSNISGSLQFDPQTPENSSVNVTIQTASVDTGVVNRAGEKTFDPAVANLLGAQDHPEITFVSTSIRRTGPTTGIMTGNLTFNGQTHPIDIEVQFHGGTYWDAAQRHLLGFSGRVVIDRLQWGVESQVVNESAGNLVEVIIETEFNQSGAAPQGNG